VETERRILAGAGKIRGVGTAKGCPLTQNTIPLILEF
jgi:hypothetical protein